MDIFEKEPEDWKDLQVKVGKLFTDMDFSVEIEKDIKTVRDTVNVDVIANYNSFPNETIIAECKNWSTAVPKTIVHAFRTVVSDFGANTGYIISKKGFQRGAYDAAMNSNIKLMTFGQFQESFKIRYLSVIVHRLQNVGYPLRRYSDWQESFFDKEIKKLSQSQKVLHSELCLKYDDISLSTVHIMNYKNILTGELDLELIDFTIERVKKDFPQIKANCYSDYFDILINLFNEGVAEFDSLFKKKLRKR